MSSRWLSFPLTLVVLLICACGSSGPPPQKIVVNVTPASVTVRAHAPRAPFLGFLPFDGTGDRTNGRGRPESAGRQPKPRGPPIRAHTRARHHREPTSRYTLPRTEHFWSQRCAACRCRNGRHGE